jgi:hypothetical protein
MHTASNLNPTTRLVTAARVVALVVQRRPSRPIIGLGAVEPAEQTVMRIARGYQLSQALYVAAKLGVADVLGP